MLQARFCDSMGECALEGEEMGRLLEQRDVIEPTHGCFAEPCPELTVVRQFFTVAEQNAARRALVHPTHLARALTQKANSDGSLDLSEVTYGQLANAVRTC